MIRQLIFGRMNVRNKVFEHRGIEVSRLENFSDAAFGFALTLLVVSQQVPKTFQDLLDVMHGFFSFAICFFILASLWWRHYLFFRHYGLTDAYTAALNAVLLFVVLYFVYPLKFIINVVTDHWLHTVQLTRLPDGTLKPPITAAELPLAFDFYFLAFAVVCGVFSLFYHHAFNRRLELRLSPKEVLETQIAIAHNLFPLGICLLSAGFFTLERGRFLSSHAVVFSLITVSLVILYHSQIRRWRRREAKRYH